MRGTGRGETGGEGEQGRGVHLEALGDDLPAGSPRRDEVRQRDECRDDEGGRREQAEGVLDARHRVVHAGRGGPLWGQVSGWRGVEEGPVRMTRM